MSGDDDVFDDGCAGWGGKEYTWEGSSNDEDDGSVSDKDDVFDDGCVGWGGKEY